MNLKDFKATKHTDRTAAIPAPDLAAFFTKGQTPEIIVRGLTAEESFRCNEAAQRSEQLGALVEALAAGNSEAAGKVAEVLGISGKETPPEYSRRLAMLELASVAPKFDHDAALLLAKNYPTLFLRATTKILELTGLNRVPGKRKGSGETDESGPH